MTSIVTTTSFVRLSVCLASDFRTFVRSLLGATNLIMVAAVFLVCFSFFFPLSARRLTTHAVFHFLVRGGGVTSFRLMDVVFFVFSVGWSFVVVFFCFFVFVSRLFVFCLCRRRRRQPNECVIFARQTDRQTDRRRR